MPFAYLCIGPCTEILKEARSGRVCEFSMTIFDRIREKNKLISLIVKIQNTAFFPALFALICVISATGDKNVYIPCAWILTAITVFTGLFSDDLKVFIVPAFLAYYVVGMDVPENYYTLYSSSPTFAPSAMWHFAACILIIVATLIYRLISSGLLREMLVKRGILFWGIILLDIALITNGLFSAQWNIKTLLFGAMLALVLTVFYMLFVTVLAHSKDGIAYACKTLVAMGFAVICQVSVIAYRLNLCENLIIRKWGFTQINRGMLSLAWGPATIIGGVLVLSIAAAIYLMHGRKWPMLSFLSAVTFWVFTVLIDTRSAIIFGGFALGLGVLLCCFSGKNKKINRLSLALLCLGAMSALIFIILKFPEDYKNIFEKILDFLRFDVDLDSLDSIHGFFTSRLIIWKDGLTDFLSAPLFGTGFSLGYFTPETASDNLFINMYHNIFVQLLASTGIVGVFMFLIHMKHVAEIILRRFSVDKLLLIMTPLCILGMSTVDNFFFYPNFIIVYTAMLAAAEVTLEQKRQARLDNLKRIDPDRKPRVVFTYVEAGKGHIIPTRTVCDEFRKYYGDKCEIVESKFFTETGDKNLEKTEVLFHRAVQNQNRSPILSFLCKLGNLIAGDTFALFVLLRMSFSGIRTNPRAVKHVEELDADVVYSAHWSTPFYINQLKTPRPYTICFCPDVYSNGAFNVDCNNFLISSDVGYNQVSRTRMYAGGNVTQIPFPMRPEAEKYKGEEIRSECRAKLGIPDDAFVVALCDGGYGMARLEGTVKHLMRATEPMTIIALCGMNHELFLKLDELSRNTPEHIRLIAVDFTDRMLDYLVCADLFAGKSGANAIAEPAALGIPIIVTKCITYIERGIKNYHVRKLKGAIYIPSCRFAAKKIRKFAKNPALLKPMRDNLINNHRQTYDAKASADLIWQRVCEMRERS